MKRLMMLLVSGMLIVPSMAWAYRVPTELGWSATAYQARPGVHLYKNGSEYIQVVQADQGARVTLPHGTVSTSGVVGFRRVATDQIATYWSGLAQDPRAFAVTNAAFFDPGSSPTGIAFPLKVDNDTFAHGYATSCWVGVLRILKIWDDRFRIENYSGDIGGVTSSTSQNIIGGLTENANCPTHPEITSCIGEQCKGGTTNRTFVGCADPQNGNGDYNTLLIFTSVSSTSAHAVTVLRGFSGSITTPVMMLDGGGSTQMTCLGIRELGGDGRALPSMLGVLSADVTNPTVPINLSATPPGCSVTNSFTFNWSGSTDAGGSGLAGYRWRINGGIISQQTGVSVTTTAPFVGTHTFEVWAYDNAGNESGKPSISFCYQPPVGPCPGREISHSPCGSPCPAAVGTNLQTLPNLTTKQWRTVGQPVREMLRPGETYSVGFEYRSTVTTDAKLGLGSFNPLSAMGLLVSRSVLPESPEQWRTFWSAPFTATSDQLREFPTLRLALADPRASTVELRSVRIMSALP